MAYTILRQITFGKSGALKTFYPTPGSIKVSFENQDGGGDTPGAGTRNATPIKVEFGFVVGADFDGSTNPTLAEVETLRTHTHASPDTDANLCVVSSDVAVAAVDSVLGTLANTGTVV